MTLSEEIKTAFPNSSADLGTSESGIRNGRGPMEDGLEESLISKVPVYLLYCLSNIDEDSLILMHTINALAEYGRCKDPGNNYLNFKFQCNTDQIGAVVKFLSWAQTQSSEDQDQISRALRNWSKALEA